MAHSSWKDLVRLRVDVLGLLANKRRGNVQQEAGNMLQPNNKSSIINIVIFIEITIFVMEPFCLNLVGCDVEYN